jgi:hypothetical protein
MHVVNSQQDFSRRGACGSLHPSAGVAVAVVGAPARATGVAHMPMIGYGMRGRAAGAGAPGLGYAAFAIRYAAMGIWMGPGCPARCSRAAWGLGGRCFGPVRPRVSRYKI